jgi:dTDP-4-amino-4,6-dideoxygalactose transaminase
MSAASVAPRPTFPFLDLRSQFSTIRNDVVSAVTRVLDSQHFILGEEVSALEKELGKYLDVDFAITCASGSDALLLSLMALGIKSGDEVITVPFSFIATAGSVARLGALPVFVDIDPVTYNLDPNKLEAAITSKTRAILPVHLFGLAAEMDPILEVATRHGIPVIEDAAQAIGATYTNEKVGRIGSIGCFSFFPSKNLGAAGDGGLMTTNNSELAARLALLRVHGSRNKYEYQCLGTNSRLDAIQAAILRVKLVHLDSWTEDRRRNAMRYRTLFEERDLSDTVITPFEPAHSKHVYNQFTIRLERRDALRKFLQGEGIPSEIYYPYPLHLQPALQNLRYRPGSLPHAELACEQVLSLPIYPELTPERQEAVVDAIARFTSKTQAEHCNREVLI